MNALGLRIIGSLLLLLPGLASAQQPLTCVIHAKVIPSQKYGAPKTEYTRLKNDGKPMLLIGVDILSSRVLGGTKNRQQQQYCQSLTGQKKDIYLSRGFDPNDIQIHLGDELTLKHLHLSAKQYPFWPDFYYPLTDQA
ncbi:hypothetical protein [Acinetobacter sp. MD2(2019)]|uniref:hypothetical protein n=1 Tax=Acinetobacter sp. MD2(2019) TaxID=2605273 RepID=UPI002D1EF340|nr:hypothetical protein [Acinetobacter sp. MD2(2019)]MEB3754101.1 hypothetical protein [Acinetobacter sp. MD2(2019)]